MRIVFVCPLTPYLPCHDPVRSRPAHLLASLAAGHDVAVVAMTSSGETSAQRRWVSRYCASVDLVAIDRWRHPLTGAPERGLAAARAALEHAIARVRPDVLHLEGALLAPLSRTGGIPTVLTIADSPAMRARDARTHATGLGAWLRATLDHRIEAAWERRWFPAVDAAVVPSEQDRKELARHIPFARVDVIPSGIDVEHYAFRRTAESNRIVFVGNLAWGANVAAVQRLVSRVLPAIRRARPRVELVVIGADPAGAARGLAATPGVRLIGSVSDIRPTLWTASASVSGLAPGLAIKNRVLETMALGTPVVGRREALAGIPSLLPGHHALAADNDDEIIEALLLILRQPVVAQTLARNARTLVETHHTWTAVARDHHALYARIAGHESAVAVAA